MRLLQRVDSVIPWPEPIAETDQVLTTDHGSSIDRHEPERCRWYVLWDGSAVRVPMLPQN
jgi:hypothetical protein